MKVRGRFLPSWFLLGWVPVLFSGCLLVPHSRGHTEHHHAFIDYWPKEAHKPGLKLAVKDNIDMRGVVTTAGSEYLAKNNPPAKADAQCLAIARARGVPIVGKTNLSEFAVAPSGFNEYYGTPKSPLSHMHRLIPGGSSCGSAVAVARGYADVSFGTDTAGSVRVPAACCGVVGLKTTFGLVSLHGVVPVEPKHLDTVGPIGKNVEDTAKGMDLLEAGFAGKYAAAKAAKPAGRDIRVGRLYLKGTSSGVDKAVDAALQKAGFKVVPLDERFREKWDQAKKDGNTMAAAGVWLSEGPYLTRNGVSARTKATILVGRVQYPLAYRRALARREEWQEALRHAFHKVDFIALPTLQSTPPGIPPNLKIGLLEIFMLDFQNTVAVNFAGNPALAVPVPLAHTNVRLTSLQLIAPPKKEAELLNAGRLVEQAVKPRK
ncbi:Amidase [Chthoniobacter flavus Ellin428]|uniref:Amidase n=1 Tax=Chthoniobacter flavus Ellin428 TaxID=497964 RepID=B4CUJ4_9BACT|nr:amidase [Chthoniobacter flavus]EDY22232.1 Amidase [Chthoniobacter flavus Ellin428]TCO94743.1 amidase [Chthoniobacter flavus]